MKHALLILMVIISTSVFASIREAMNSYQETIQHRRVSEAEYLWKTMANSGFSETTVAALDFTFFTNAKADAEKLAKALSENYTITVSNSAKEPDYWLIKGSTRPYGKQFSYVQWLAWVDFMVSIGFSNNCVFSTWAAYDPKSKHTWSSESVEVE
jgi:hypothetical protein